jgi:hypothetical protein
MTTDSGTASLFQQSSTTELAASSSWTFDHEGHFLVDGNLGRWNLQQEENNVDLNDLFYDWREASLTGETRKLVKQAEADAISIIVGAEGVAVQCQSLPLSSSNQPSKLLLETRSRHGPPPKPFRMQSVTTMILGDAEEPRSPQYFTMVHLSEPPPSSRPPLTFKNITPPLKPQRARSISYLEEEEEDATQDVAPPSSPTSKRILSLLDCVEIQAVFSQPVPEEDAKVSSPAMPKRMELLTDYDVISAALLSPHDPPGRGGLTFAIPSLLPSSSPGFFDSGANPPRSIPSISSCIEEEDETHDAAPPRIPKRMPSLLDCVEIQAVFLKPVPEDVNVSSPAMPKRMMESLTDYDDISVARWSAHPSLFSSPGFFFSGANPPRIPCRRGSIMMDTA